MKGIRSPDKTSAMVNQSDITRLRKEGKLEEAHALALEGMASQSDDIWIRRAYCWVLYALTKSCLEQGDQKGAGVHFDTFRSLNMPADETILYENFNHFAIRLHPKAQKAKKLSDEKKYKEALRILWELLGEENLKILPDLHIRIAWEIWHVLKTLDEASGPNLKALEKLTEQYRQLICLPRPSLVHSVVLGQLLRLPEGLRGSFDFGEWFRFWRIPEDFMEKDWLPYNQAPSLAERACNAWSRSLVQKGRFLPPEEVASALEKLEAIADAHSDFIWLPYFTAKIRLVTSTGAPEEARARLLPFVRSKRTEFWAWDLLADAFPPEETDMIEACLCKALSCQTDPKYLVRVKARLGRLRAQIGIPEDAPLEEGAARAEDFVFGDRRVQGTAVVEGIDRNTGAVYFALSKEIRGRFPSKKYPKWDFRPGDLFDVRLLKMEKADKTFWEVRAIEAPTGLPHQDVYRVFSGKFKQGQGQAFGFVEDAFVPPPLVSQNQLLPGQAISVSAILALDPRKNQFGWKAVKITNH